MTEIRRLRERHVWIAVVTALSTSLAWLAAINLALLASNHGAGMETALTVARALARAALALAREGWPLAMATLVVGALTGLLLREPRRQPRLRAGARHA